MRGRCSRKLSVLAKALSLLWLLWLGYLLIAHTTFPSHSSPEESDMDQSHLAQQMGKVETWAEGPLSKPVYEKPPPDNNAPGEWGRATHLKLSPDEKKLEEDSVERYAINIYVSDKISLHRHIQDQRMAE